MSPVNETARVDQTRAGMEGRMKAFARILHQKLSGLALSPAERRLYDVARDEVARWHAVSQAAPWRRPENARKRGAA